MLFLQTQAYKTSGGMQAYMRRVAEIMTAVCGELQEPFVSVSVTDLAANNDLHPNPVHYDKFVGAASNKPEFVAATVKILLRRRHRVAVLGHVSLATTGYLLKRSRLIDRYILVLHGVEAWRQERKYVRTACRHSAAIISTTRYTACEFQVQNLFAHPRMHVVPLALPETKLPPFNGKSRNAKLEVLGIGRLDASERYKGFESVMTAVGKLARSGSPIRLRIAGSGNDFERLQAHAKSVAPGGAIEMLGHVPDNHIAELYRTCDVFAMPSKKEGFGIVFLEAMRFGKPCIGGRHGGTPEVIRDGVDGFLVDYGDEDSVAQILGQFCSDRTSAQQMGRTAYERTASEYVFPVMKERWRTILRNVHES